MLKMVAFLTQYFQELFPSKTMTSNSMPSFTIRFRAPQRWPGWIWRGPETCYFVWHRNPFRWAQYLRILHIPSSTFPCVQWLNLTFNFKFRVQRYSCAQLQVWSQGNSRPFFTKAVQHSEPRNLFCCDCWCFGKGAVVTAAPLPKHQRYSALQCSC